jgi:ABC-2 type transport system ATP-binding protein
MARSTEDATISGAEAGFAPPAIEAVGLEKSYGDVRVLRGVDLRVERGTVFALLGPNGAGKTTTVRILATLLRPDAGQARVAGFDVARDRALVRRSISLTGQYVSVDDLQTGEENLRMMARLSGLRGARVRSRARELLERFDLVDAGHRRVKTYSGGMRRRLDLAASLVGSPSVLFLDEPTTGLDLPGRQAMWKVVTDLSRSGVTIFLTTQYLEEADRLADRIAVIDGGRVVADDTPDALKARFGQRLLDLTMVDREALDRLTSTLTGRIVASDPAALTASVATDGSAADVRDLLDRLDPERTAVRSFVVRMATLDDVFLALTGHTATTADVHKETADV